MALPNDMQRITNGLAALEVSNPTYSQATYIPSRSIIRRTIVLPKPAADSGTTATAYTAAYAIRNRTAGRILGFYVIPAGAVTADATNNAVVSLITADGLGGTQVVAATLTTDVNGGAWAAGVVKTGILSATAANLRYAAGTILGFAISKGGTGVAVPICELIVDIEEESADGYAVY